MSTPTRRDELTRDDAQARRRAREEFRVPLVLEAGAGTGKTTALVTRVVAWGLGPGWERAEARLAERDPGEPAAEEVAARLLGGVVAITFTEAAAAEMSQRVAEALLAVESGRLPDWLDEEALPADVTLRAPRAAALRGALDHLVVQTIHAYCRRLLVMHPLEAGLHPQLEIDAEQRLQGEIVREVLEDHLLRAYAEPGDARHLELAARGIGPPELEEQLLALLEAGLASRDLEADPLAPPRVQALMDRARDATEGFRAAHGGALRKVSRGRVASDTADLVEAMLGKLSTAPDADRGALEAVLGWLEENAGDSERKRLRDWAKGKFTRSEGDALGGRCDALAEAAAAVARALDHLASLDLELLDLARPVVRELLADVEERLRVRGVATFSALLTETRRVLWDRPEVADRVRSRIDQLLVDEFQDTDRRQCDIVRALALAGPESSRPGLFVVGDPKQSIYGWRSADLAAYDAFVDDVEAAGGRVERLSVNYRSAPVLLDEVERVVAPVMERREGVQPAFQPLVPGPKTADETGFSKGRFAPTEYWVSARWDAEGRAPQATRSAEASALEAGALARDVRELHDEHGVDWKEMGVLFRGRGDLELYLAALRAAGVPFAVEGDRSYYQRREVIDASALVRCALDPNDHLALLTLLRSAAVGVPDAALIPLWTRRLPSRLGALSGDCGEALEELRGELAQVVRELPDGVPGLDRIRGWEENLLAVARALALAREAFRREPADRFVERLRSLTLFEVTEAARYLGAWRAANLERFFRELAEELAEGASPHAVLRRLRRGVGRGEQREEGRPKEAVEDAVQVMTIHGAKGLDFEHVYVMQLHKGKGRGDGAVAVAGELSGVAEYRLLGAPSLGWDRVAAERSEVSEAERVRALYVATTRAKQRLVLAGVWPELQRRRSPGQTLELLARRSEPPPDLGEAMAGCAEAGEPYVDAAHTRWVFPALLDPGEEGAARRRESAAGVATPGRAADDSKMLRAARDQARARGARAFGGTATGAAEQEDLASEGERRFGERAPRERGEPAPGHSDVDAVARAVGTALHVVLEEIDLDAEPAAALAGAREILERAVRATAPGAFREAALEDARALLDRVAAGELLRRLRALGAGLLLRELPVLLPPEDAGTGPVAYVAGVADLVYRDPHSGEIVVADYKTDRALGEAEMAERARHYAAQGAVYQAALRQALGLDRAPRFELWFLRADRIVPAVDQLG